MIPTIPSRHTKFDVASTSIWLYDAIWLYGRWSDVEEAKGLTSNFIWWSKIIHVFLNKIEITALSETLGKRTKLCFMETNSMKEST